jgi:deoxyribonuclease V
MAKKRVREDIRPGETGRARELQIALASKVKIIPLKEVPRFIAAVDAAFLDDMVIAVASLYKYPELVHVEDAFFKGKTRFPYIPGFLSFREGPAAISALKKLKIQPDLILVDGQGMAHPRGIGLASHIGVILHKPAIGCAKSRLIGEFEEPAREKGRWTYLYLTGDPCQPIGAVVRTRRGVKPLFVSPGHLIDIDSSVDIVMQCTTAYRIPNPLRRADMLSRKKIREGV